MEELEPLLGAVIVLECDDWVFIPGELEGIPCEKLLLKSSKVIKCPKGREVKCPVEISKKLWTAVDADFRERLGLEWEKEKGITESDLYDFCRKYMGELEICGDPEEMELEYYN